MTTTEKKTLTVGDIYAASFLALRTRLLATQQEKNRTNFVFDDTAGQATAASLDYVNSPVVGLREYLAAFKELRAIAYASRNASK